MPTGSHLAPAGVCLVGSFSLPVLPGKRGPRALPPLRARGPLNRPPAVPLSPVRMSCPWGSRHLPTCLRSRPNSSLRTGR